MIDHHRLPEQSRAPLNDEPPQLLLHRRSAITTGQIGRFVSIFLRELVTREGHHYDAVYTAFAESGIQPLPSMQCETFHFDVRIERLNRLADVLVEQLRSDDRVRAAMGLLVTTVLNQHTTPAPDQHLTNHELQEFISCCRSSDEGSHMAEERYAAQHAHLGACSPCDVRLRATLESIDGSGQDSSTKQGSSFADPTQQMS